MKIEMLHVPNCANVGRARKLLDQCLAELSIVAAVEDHEGDYLSPTILVNGVDVMGRSDYRGVGCRPDVPTQDRIFAALRPVARA